MAVRSASFLSFPVAIFLVLISVTCAAVYPWERPPVNPLSYLDKQAPRLNRKGASDRKTIATFLISQFQTFRARASNDGFLRSRTSSKAPYNKKSIISDFIDVQVPQLHVSSRQLGLNGDNCRGDPDCAGTRTCQTSAITEGLECSGSDCICAPKDLSDADCSTDSDCDDGETCLDRNGDGLGQCISDNVTRGNSTPTPTTAPSTNSSSTERLGFNGDLCSENSDCTGTRMCQTGDENGFIPCKAGTVCVCAPLDSLAFQCTVDSDCDDGESCIDDSIGGFCISNNLIAGNATATSPISSGLNGNICAGSSDCAGTRACRSLFDIESQTCRPGEPCICVSLELSDAECTANSDCDDGEFCTQFPGDTVGSNACISEDLISTGPNSAPTTNSSSTQTSGLNGELCAETADCADGRACLTRSNDDIIQCKPDKVCLCAPIYLPDTLCTLDFQCDIGESCISVPGFSPGAAFCLSNDIISETAIPNDSSRLNGDLCNRNSDCAGERVCQALRGGREVSECTIGAVCICLPTDLGSAECTGDSDCDNGESCIEGNGSMLCISHNVISDRLTSSSPGSAKRKEDGSAPPTASPSAEEGTNESDAVCIGIESLTHFAMDELVFKQHALAHVLCDSNESCATPGHMVVYKGVTVMMRSYCELVGCTKKVKRVNSPRYVQKLTVPSETEGLLFTAFAARFETYAEENMLSLAVRLGL